MPDVAQRCMWPAGPHDEVVIDMGTGGTEVWCLAHDDDMLPEVDMGRLSGCAVCGKTSITWTADKVCLHSRCRRDWLRSRLNLDARGAYARRKK